MSAALYGRDSPARSLVCRGPGSQRFDIARGTNVVQLSRLLGHHAPSFTLDVYSHLLEDGVGAPLDLDAELERGGARARAVESANTVQTTAALGGPDGVAPAAADSI